MAEIRKEPFGTLGDGRPVELYTLRNTKGTEVKVITYGARLVSWRFQTRASGCEDILLGYEDIASYEQDDKYMGAVVGRHANRIADGIAIIGGKEYALECNDGSRKQNHLHGGFSGFDKKLWKAEESEEGLILRLSSPAGEGGYPGNMQVTVLYGLSDDDELSIRYEAVSDEDTVCNLTNHAYFNLDGFAGGAVLDQKLRIFADSFTENDAESLPTGKILPVEGTPMDFRQMTAIGARIDAEDEQLRRGRGYDHNWILGDAPDGAGNLRKAAEALSEKTGILLRVYTTLPGIQFYSGNYLDGKFRGKNGARFDYRNGFCLETQYYPNAFRNPGFPQPVLKKGETWKAQTIYALGTVPNS